MSRAEEDEVVRMRVGLEIVRRLAWGREFLVKCKGLGRFVVGGDGKGGSSLTKNNNSSRDYSSVSVNRNNSEMFGKELVKLNFEESLTQ